MRFVLRGSEGPLRGEYGLLFGVQKLDADTGGQKLGAD